LLGEKVGWHRWQAIAVGLCGALIIARPDPSLENIGNMLVLGSAITFALYQILNRKLAGVDPPETMIAYTALIATVVFSSGPIRSGTCFCLSHLARLEHCRNFW
jgi:drug/metabolite transporter (DMT)-like permease